VIGESKSQYVSRKVDSYRKEYQRRHESEDIPIDADEFRHGSLEVKHGAEDWFDFWDEVTPW